MALILKDRVQETSTTTGTGTLTLAGAVTQFQTFSSAVGNGNTTYYTIYNAGGMQWEVGLGTVGAGTLSRDTVLASSNANALVSFTGTLYVFGDYPAGKAVYLDAIGTATVSQLATSSTTSTTPVLSYNASNSNYAAGATVSGSYLQTVMQNKSGTAGASTNLVVSNDLGTDSTYYGEFGMNSSVFSSGTPADFFSLNNGIYYSGHDGPITVGSGNGSSLYLAWGTTGQSAHVINATGSIGLNTNITGTSNFGTSGQVLTSQGNAATPTWTTPTTGTVTSVSGTSGRITSTGGATPVIDLANGVATAGTTGSGTLIPVITIDTYGRVTSITTASNPQGTVTSVTGTAPVVSSGGTTPAISMAAANTTTNGYLTSTDWNTFNGKGSGSVTSVNLTASTGISVSGGPVTSSGSITVTNTAPMTYPGSGIPNSTGSAWGTSYTTSGSGTVVALATGATFSNASFAGSTSVLAAILTNAAEVCTVSATAATGTIAYYPSTQSVLYYTSNASANWTANFAFSSGTTLNTAMATGQSLTVAFLVTQGATAYYNNVVQVDGTTTGVTTKWQGSAAPTAGNASGVDVYTYTIVKTGSATFTVFATQTQFK